MGGCETHSAGLAHRPPEASTPPANARPRQATIRQAFLACDHRPPLAGVKLVRPRQRPDGRTGCGRSSLTRGRAAARSQQLRGNPAQQPTPGRLPGHRVRTARSVDSEGPHGWLICVSPPAQSAQLAAARSRRSARFGIACSTNRCLRLVTITHAALLPSSDSAATPEPRPQPGPGLSFGLTGAPLSFR